MDTAKFNAAERAVWEAFDGGATVDLGGAPESVRASVLQARLRSGEPPSGRPALSVRGARIVGKLMLAYADIPFPLLLKDCDFDEAPDLYWARLRYTSLAGSRLPGLLASSVQVDGNLRLSGCHISGPVKLGGGARITGSLLLDGARLRSPDTVALAADRLQLGGDLVGHGGFTVEGDIRISNADIGGELDFDDARLTSPGRLVLGADNITIKAGAYFRRAVVDGIVHLRHARIAGALTLSGAHLRNPGATTLRADRSEVEGGLFLLGDFRSEGEIRLVGAHIGRTLKIRGSLENAGAVALRGDHMHLAGSLEADGPLSIVGELSLRSSTIDGPILLEGATLSNPDGAALSASGLTAGSLLNLCDGFTAAGRIHLSGARIGDRLCLNDARLVGHDGEALKAWRMTAGEVSMRATVVAQGTIDLRHSRVDVFRDDPEQWPETIRLDGLAYDRLEPSLPARRRLQWIRRASDGYLPGVYENLAASYRRLGDDREARTVLLAKQRHHRATLPWYARTWGWLQDRMVGYGYRPLRAAAWFAALLTIGTVAVGVDRPRPGNAATAPLFDPLLYTLDTLLPFVDLGQQTAFVPVGIGQQYLMDVLLLFAWILATTIAAGVARSLRRD